MGEREVLEGGGERVHRALEPEAVQHQRSQPLGVHSGLDVASEVGQEVAAQQVLAGQWGERVGQA